MAAPSPSLTIVPKLSHAEAIGGWMSMEELTWLATQARRHSRIIELGSYLGRSTRALADNTPGTVYAIDRWKKMEYMVHLHPDDTDLYHIFHENLGDLIRLGKVVAIRAEHDDYSSFPVEWLRGQAAEKPDMVFIDGDHDYEAVCRDITAWQKRLKVGGLLCGHDASSHDWPGVDMAISELLPEATVVVGTSIWWVRV